MGNCDVVEWARHTLFESNDEDEVDHAMQVLVNHGYVTLDADTIVLNTNKNRVKTELDQARDTLRNAAWLRTDEERELIEKAVELLCGEPGEDAISRQAAKEAVKRASASGTVQMLLMEILDGMPSVNPMPCEDVISRQAAIDALKKYFSDDGMKDTECGAYWHHGHVIDVLQGMPSVTPKQRTGHWIECEDEVKCFCSECKEISDYPTKFCPNCGTKMVEPQESEK